MNGRGIWFNLARFRLRVTVVSGDPKAGEFQARIIPTGVFSQGREEKEIRRGVRVVEGARLESVYTVNLSRVRIPLSPPSIEKGALGPFFYGL